MSSKSELTTKYIIEKVAPVFNRIGYAGTSMSDISKATGLTKGSVYGNFKNKEELAIQAFNYNVRKVIWKLADEMNVEESATMKFRVMTNFYRRYYSFTQELGGCPILNIGVDSNNTNPLLYERVTTVLKKLQKNLADIVTLGIMQNEFKKSLNAEEISAQLVSMIQGAIFSSVLLKEEDYLSKMMDHVDELITNKLIK